MLPKYIIIKDKINSDISKNIYPIGSNLPTEMELASIYNVSRSTIRQALELLKEQGIISKRWGSGNTVISKSDSTKKQTVMVLLYDKEVDESKELLSDLSSILLKNNYKIELLETENRFQKEREYLTYLLNDIYAGLIVYPAHSNLPSPNLDLFQLLLKHQTPIVFINSAPALLYNPLTVGLDFYNKGYQMARSLINQGHKNIGGIFSFDNADSVKTFSGFTDAIRDAGLEILDDCFLWYNLRDSNYVINEFLEKTSETASTIYIDDRLISTADTYPVVYSSLNPSKSLGKECAFAFLELKKNGNNKSITIPFKI